MPRKIRLGILLYCSCNNKSIIVLIKLIVTSFIFFTDYQYDNSSNNFIIMQQTNKFPPSFLQKLSTRSIRKKFSGSQRPKSLPRNIINKASNNNNNNSCDIYFDPTKKAIYIKDIVQSYFDANQQQFSKLSKMPMIKEKKILSASLHLDEKTHRRRSNLKNNINEQKPLIKSVDFNMYQKQLQYCAAPISFPPKILPPIDQVDDKDDFDDDTFSLLGQTQLSTLIQINPEQQRQQRVLVYQNDAFKVFVILVNGKAKYRMKQFKISGSQILKREQKINKLEIPLFWKQSRFNPNCLMSSMSPPIKDLLCKFHIEYENKDIIHKISPRSYHRYLLKYNNAELLSFVQCICNILKKCQGKVLNNKVNLSNIFLKDGKPIIAEWGHSAFRNQFNIQQNKMESRSDPILRSQNQWFVTPQYLAPQVLHQMTMDSAQDLWQHPLADIWSLGCIIFQILTLIPLWSFSKCYVKGKQKLGRKGLLGTENRNLAKIQQKQIKFRKNYWKFIRTECKQEDLNPKILKLLQGMLQLEPSKRMSIDQILAQLREK